MNSTDLESIPVCDGCGKNKFRLFINVPDRNYRTGNFRYVECLTCHLVRLNPRPKPHTLHRYYPRMYPAYQNFAHKTPAQIYFRQLIKKYSFLAKIFIKDQLFYWSPKGRLLDVGTGSGAYIAVLNDWGWQAEGVEMDSYAVTIAKRNKLRVKYGTLFSAKYPSGSFAVVRFSHVLEHVPSPKSELKETWRILNKGGSVVLLVPNIASLTFIIFRSYWYLLEPPRHFFQFTPNTLEALLNQTKFKVTQIKYIQSPNPIWWSILYMMGLGHGDKKLGLLSYPLGQFFKFVSMLRLSDIIEVTAQKI